MTSSERFRFWLGFLVGWSSCLALGLIDLALRNP